MEGFITVLIIVACVLLAFVILIQNPKGGGLDSSFGSASQLGGVQKTTNFLEKTTWGLMIAIVVLSIVSASFTGNTAEGVNTEFQDAAPTQQQVAPNQPVAPTQQPEAQPASPEQEGQ